MSGIPDRGTTRTVLVRRGPGLRIPVTPITPYLGGILTRNAELTGAAAARIRPSRSCFGLGHHLIFYSGVPVVVCGSIRARTR